MTSAINEIVIDTDFPVAGVDNDSQGFRDNFSGIKDALGTARGEITDLQTYSAKIGNTLGTEVVNNFNGNIISNAKTSKVYANAYQIYATSNTNISWNDGEYQTVEVRGNFKLTFIDWPEADGYGKMRIELKSNGTAWNNITFAAGSGYSLKKEIGTALVTVAGAVRNAQTGSVPTTQFSFPTASFTTITAAGFQVDNLLTGSGLTNDVVISVVDNITTNATATAKLVTAPYNDIVIGVDIEVKMNPAFSSFADGDPITLPNVTGIIGIAQDTIYYAHATGGGNIKLSSVPTPYTAITGGGGTYTGGTQFAKFPQTNNSNRVTVGDSQKMYVNMPIKFGVNTTANSADSSTNRITVISTSNMFVNMPVVFTVGSGSIFGGLIAGTTYYIKSIVSSTLITLSESPGGVTLAVTTSSGSLTLKTYHTLSNIVSGQEYYVHSKIDSTGIRLKETLSSTQPFNIDDNLSGTLTMEPRTVLTTTFNSQTVTAGSGLTLTTNVQGVPTPFTVDADPTRVKIIEVWKQPYEDIVFLKYLGEFA